MRKLDSVKRNHFGRKLIMQTQGSKTFQYLVENRPIGISLVAASEKERAQTEPSLATARGCKTITSHFDERRVTKCFVSRILWKEEP